MDEKNNVNEKGHNKQNDDNQLNNQSPLDYTLEFSSSSSSSVRIIYHVTEDTYKRLLTRPVLACGGSFKLEIDPNGKGIYTNAITSDPHNTAIEIAKRLAFRLNDDGGDVNPCPMA